MYRLIAGILGGLILLVAGHVFGGTVIPAGVAEVVDVDTETR